MRKPNFFIVGAPRCGTTALYTYLNQHPDVTMPIYDKEPHYFGSDLVAPRFERFRGNERKYIALFSHGINNKCIGEASVYYLRAERAAQEIHVFNPSAKILIMVRHPVDMLFSYYLKLHSNQHEPLPTFEAALLAEEKRRNYEDIPRNLYLPVQALWYRSMVQFAPQIQRYYDIFGQDQVKVIIFDDFQSDTSLIYREILQFLEINSDFTVDFERINSTQEVQSPMLKRLLRQRWLVQIGDSFYPVAAPIYQRLVRMNHKPIPRPVLDPKTRESLLHELRPSIDELSQLLERDLSHWYQ